jgi:hypothetical protein
VAEQHVGAQPESALDSEQKRLVVLVDHGNHKVVILVIGMPRDIQ